MADKETVIKGLKKVWDAFDAMEHELYADYVFDALALLQEQEPKQVETEVLNEINRLYKCPSCHIAMIFRKQPYCHWCGQGVKWE